MSNGDGIKITWSDTNLLLEPGKSSGPINKLDAVLNILRKNDAENIKYRIEQDTFTVFYDADVWTKIELIGLFYGKEIFGKIITGTIINE